MAVSDDQWTRIVALVDEVGATEGGERDQFLDDLRALVDRLQERAVTEASAKAASESAERTAQRMDEAHNQRGIDEAEAKDLLVLVQDAAAKQWTEEDAERLWITSSVVRRASEALSMTPEQTWAIDWHTEEPR